MEKSSFALFVWVCFAILIVWIMCKLADVESRKIVTWWVVFGLGFAVIKNLLVQLAPQWGDVPLDSLTYQLHGQAIYMHWMGMPVDAAEQNLSGYLAGWQTIHGPHWNPDAPISYTGVLGTHEWIYSAFLAGWRCLGEDWVRWAILANAAMAGAFPAATYLLVRHLGGSVRVGHFGAILIALEPSTAVNSAWLLKDTLAGFVAIVVVILICRLYSRPSWRLATLLAVVLGLLAGIRFVAFAAFILALCGLIALLVARRSQASAAAFAAATSLSVLVSGLMYFSPQMPTPGRLILAFQSPLQAQMSTLRAKGQGDRGWDDSVSEWRSYLRDQPVRAVARSVARTLMAPYPWVAFTDGLRGNNYIELYLPGSVLWIMSLPAIFLGMGVAARNAGPKAWVSIAVLGLLAGAYIVFFGEWSTRQRIFMMPLFFAFAALGWHKLWKLTPYGRSDIARCRAC